MALRGVTGTGGKNGAPQVVATRKPEADGAEFEGFISHLPHVVNAEQLFPGEDDPAWILEIESEQFVADVIKALHANPMTDKALTHRPSGRRMGGE